SPRISRTEKNQRRRARRRCQVADPGIVTDVNPRALQPAGQFVQIVETHGLRKGLLRAGAPSHGHVLFEMAREFSKAFERPIFPAASGEWMNYRAAVSYFRTNQARHMACGPRSE